MNPVPAAPDAGRTVGDFGYKLGISMAVALPAALVGAGAGALYTFAVGASLVAVGSQKSGNPLPEAVVTFFTIAAAAGAAIGALSFGMYYGGHAWSWARRDLGRVTSPV